jgi:hypothetical protein
MRHVAKAVKEEDRANELGMFPKKGGPPTEWKHELEFQPGRGAMRTNPGNPVTGVHPNTDGAVRLRTHKKPRKQQDILWANCLAHEVVFHGVLGYYDRFWTKHPRENGWAEVPADKIIEIPKKYRPGIRSKFKLQ